MHRLIVLAALFAITAPASAQRIVVTHKGASTVGIYDATSGRELALLPTGAGPHEVAVSSDGRWAAVSDYGAQVNGSTLTIVDIAAGAVASTVTLPEVRPHGILFLGDRQTVAVTAERAGKVLLVDVVAGTVKGEMQTGQRLSHMVAISPDAKTLYTANISDGTLSIIPADGGAPVIVPVGTMTEAIAASPDGRTVWLGSNNTGKVFVVDVAEQRVVDSVQTPGFPYRIAFTPDNRIAIVTNPQQDEIRLIDAATREVVKVIRTASGGPTQPFGLIVSPRGDRAWITLAMSAEVLELALPSGDVVRRFSVGQGTGPDGIAFLP